MITQIFTVYDSKAEAYLPPFFMQSRGLAIRSFTDTVNDPKTQLHNHPGDFMLMYVGKFDDSDCTFDLAKVPENLGLAAEFLSPPIDTSPIDTMPVSPVKE